MLKININILNNIYKKLILYTYQFAWGTWQLHYRNYMKIEY